MDNVHMAAYFVHMATWTTIANIAEELGVSRRVLEHALANDGQVNTKSGVVEVVQRDAEEEDYASLNITRRTKRLVAIMRDDSDQDDIDESAIERQTRAAMSGTGSTEATLEWLERIRSGEETRNVFTAKGERFEDEPWSETAQLRAAMNAQQLREFLDERERNYIPRELVADALVSTASLVATRLSSVPSRLADRLSAGATTAEIRAILTDAIDEIRTELGDAAERHLEQLVGAA